jgi:HAD superfamily hydrolase (TIGR01450 family)
MLVPTRLGQKNFRHLLMTKPPGIIFDIDGTVLRGGQMIRGARQTIDALRLQEHPLLFITNALESPEEQVARLVKVNIDASPDEIVTAPLLLKRYLLEQLPGATIFVIGDPPLPEMLSAEYRLSEDPNEIDAVIVSCDRNFNFHKLNMGFQALRRGARFLAVNADATCPLPDGEIPDAGAVIGALHGCSKRSPELVFGKPSHLIAEAALKRLNRSAEECLIIGDSLESDMVMGHHAGMTTVLVLSGVTQRDDLAHAPVQPDHVLESIADVFQMPEIVSIANQGK